MKDGLRADASDNALSATEITSQGNPGMPRTPLIGREHEIRVIHETLLREDVPLLTLTGPGGVGKTRLALQVMSRIASDFPSGVFFVELASVRDPELVLPSIARAIGVSDTGSRSVAEQVIQHLLHRRVLLMLDNLEQVIDASPDIATLLSHCPLLTVLVTSRVVLHVSGEHDIPVDPLPPPTAVQLFVTRARAANPSFSLTAGNQAAVTAICARLDGLPLAIELAAARVASLPPAALLARLKDALSLLTVGSRDQPDRLRTMRNAIAWSHDLLSSEEQVLFRRLAVFVDGFSLEAAEELSRIDNQCPDAFNGLASLVDKSIVKEIGGPEADEPRYRMLEIVREYGLELLEESGERDLVYRTHARMYLELSRRAEPELTGRNQVGWLYRLETDHANLRAALAWNIEHDPKAGLEMAGALIRFWDHRSHGREGRRWLEAALARTDGDEHLARAKALWGAGSLADNAGDYAAAERWLTESLALATTAGDRYLMGFAHGVLGTVALHRGDLPRAAAQYEEGLVHARAAGDDDAVAALLGGLGSAALARGNYAGAAARFEQSLETYRALGSSHGTAIELVHLGATVLELGDDERAQALLGEALVLSQRVGNKWYAISSLEGLASVATLRGQWQHAARLFGAVEALAEASGIAVHPADREKNDQQLGVIQTRMEESAFLTAYEAGKALTMSEVTAVALEFVHPSGGDSDSSSTSDPAKAAGLTAREIEVLRLLAEGLSDREIAGELSLSPRTVGGYVTKLLTKLHLESRTAAAVYAVRHKLL